LVIVQILIDHLEESHDINRISYPEKPSDLPIGIG